MRRNPLVRGSEVRDLIRLAAPVIVARSGIMLIVLADTVMVGRYSAQELAYLGIALQPLTAVMLTATGLMLGTLVVAAGALGAGRPADCGAAWRRSLPVAAIVGGAVAVLFWFGESLLTALGQHQDLATGGGPVVRILGIGLLPLLVFLASSFFLEGVRKPLPGMIAVLIANVVNVGLNALLIPGFGSIPALGAAGAAVATTAVRTLLAIGLVAYVWWLPDRDRLGLRRRPTGGWRAWVLQRRIGLAASASLGVEATSFSILGLFAGMLGTVAMATYALGLNLIALIFMMAVGLGGATAVRVGHAYGAKDPAGTARAGWLGLGVNSLVMGVLAILLAVAPGTIAGFYTTDAAVLAVAVPVVAFSALLLITDGGQAVLANALRGRGDTWVATGCHVFSYFIVQTPLAAVLAFRLDRGVLGLFEAIFVASIVSTALLAGRFAWLSARDRHVGPSQNGPSG